MSLEELRQRRLEQLKAQMHKQEEEQQVAAQVQQLEELFRRHATPDALQRYGNLKVGHPKKALQALVIFAKLIEAGKVERVTDEVLKKVLVQMQGSEKEQQFTFKRK